MVAVLSDRIEQLSLRDSQNNEQIEALQQKLDESDRRFSKLELQSKLNESSTVRSGRSDQIVAALSDRIQQLETEKRQSLLENQRQNLVIEKLTKRDTDNNQQIARLRAKLYEIIEKLGFNYTSVEGF